MNILNLWLLWGHQNPGVKYHRYRYGYFPAVKQAPINKAVCFGQVG